MICHIGVEDVYLQPADGDGRGVAASPSVRGSDLLSRVDDDTFVNCSWCDVLVLLDVVGSGCGALSCRM